LSYSPRVETPDLHSDFRTILLVDRSQAGVSWSSDCFHISPGDPLRSVLVPLYGPGSHHSLWTQLRDDGAFLIPATDARSNIFEILCDSDTLPPPANSFDSYDLSRSITRGLSLLSGVCCRPLTILVMVHFYHAVFPIFASLFFSLTIELSCPLTSFAVV